MNKPVVDEPSTEKPSDDTVNKPVVDEPSTEKPSDDTANKPVVDEPSTEKPSDDAADKPAADEPAESKPVTPPASNDAADTSDEEADKPESKPETEQETKPETTPETDKKAEPSQDESKVLLEYGITISGVNGSVSAETIEPNTDKYMEYVSADPVKGKTVLGVYDIKVDGTVDGKAKVTFTVRTEYNGKNVIILHYKDDGSYEKFAATVKDGQVTINVDSFSPFVIALDDAGDGTVPTTGVTADPGSLAVIMVLAAALGVTALLKRRSYIR